MDSVAGAAGGPSPSIQTLDIESSTSQLRLDGPAEAPPQVLDLNSPTLEIPRELPSRQGTSTPRTMSSVSDERQRAADILKLLRGFCSLGVNTEQDFEALGKTVLRDCRRFFGCDRASLLIANFAEGLFKPMWWDWESLDNPYIQRLHEVEISQFALPLGKGIAGDSFAKQQVVIVDDAQTDPRFFKEVDEVFQYRIRSIMSVPLKKVAVLNLYNKTGPAEEIFTFNQDDIDTAVALADMLSVVLEKALLQREVRESEQRLKVTWDILSYRLGVTDGMVSDFLVRWDSYLKMDPHPIDAYDWDSQHMADDECVAAFVAMMYRLGYVETFKLDRAKLVRYGLTVAGNYRQKDHVAYHNLGHATAVTHGMYKLLRRYGAKKLFGEDDIETMALVLACFCHDLDHRGLSNQYLKSQNSFLAEIAHSSVMEEHHSNFAVSILTAPECNILENLPAEDFKHVL